MPDSAEPSFAEPGFDALGLTPGIQTPRDPDMADDALGLGLPPTPAGADMAVAYRVLARKYRPQRFAELIGQDAMVQTLGNAIKRGRLAHAFLMTGVRGVGKTSTARLIAKALNCIGPNGQGGPTIDPCGQCDPCVAIAEGRHIDVIEMDAASNTGVDDVREIIEAVRYAAVSARYKIYIIDEVHMLSRNAFNALLKTLEEPPPHVKFLFATTEVNKLPVTVLSRCQRFDLRRISAELLAAHFAEICAKEAVAAEPEALALIATAADGSVRDGLSILDQAIAHADLAGADDNSKEAATVRADDVRVMLGLSDRAAVQRLFGLLVDGDGPGVLAAVAVLHQLGADPLALIGGLMEQCHAAMRAKMGVAAAGLIGEEALAAQARWAEALSHAELHRLWQLLLKGHDEVRGAVMPMEACEMALLRVVHGARLPDPGTLARLLAGQGAAATPLLPPAPPAAPGSEAPPWPTANQPTVAPEALADFPALIAALAARRPMLVAQLRGAVRLVDYAPPRLCIALEQPIADLAQTLADELLTLTGARWQIELAPPGSGAPPIVHAERGERDAARKAILASPVVRAAFDHFPEARLLDDAPAGPSHLQSRSNIA